MFREAAELPAPAPCVDARAPLPDPLPYPAPLVDAVLPTLLLTWPADLLDFHCDELLPAPPRLTLPVLILPVLMLVLRLMLILLLPPP